MAVERGLLFPMVSEWTGPRFEVGGNDILDTPARLPSPEEYCMGVRLLHVVCKTTPAQALFTRFRESYESHAIWRVSLGACCSA